MKLKSLVLALAMFLVTAPLALAQNSPIKVEGAWARPSFGAAKTGAAYMTLTNTGSDADRLLSVTTPVARMADVHRSYEDNGVMKMRPAGPLDVKPGTPVRLAPGGYHVMLMQLKAPLVEGQSFPVTLVFEKAGQVTVTVDIRKTAPAGAGTAPMNMDHMGGDHMNMDHMKH